MNFQNLLFYDNFSSTTDFASILGADALSLAMTFLAHRLNLLNHARSNLVDSYLHTRSTTDRTAFHWSFLATTTYSAGRSIVVKWYIEPFTHQEFKNTPQFLSQSQGVRYNILQVVHPSVINGSTVSIVWIQSQLCFIAIVRYNFTPYTKTGWWTIPHSRH